MKPQNILLNKSKDALVADLGTVRLAAQKDRTHAVGEKQRQMQLDAKLNLFDDRQQGKVNINETKQYVNATGMTTMLGTPAYMAPEQTWSEDYTFPVDVWAFGSSCISSKIGFLVSILSLPFDFDHYDSFLASLTPK